MVVAYDNFNFYENVRHQVSGKTGVMRSVTTGKVFLGHDIPDGGLLQTMLHENVPLDYKDVMVSDGTRRNKAHNQISSFFIAEAIRGVYPEAVQQLYGTEFDAKYPRPPSLPEERLPPSKTEAYPLGPIMANEGTINGTYDVHDTIFESQFKLKRETDFKDRLFLVYGDQKTAQLIRSVKLEQRTAELDYDRRDWLLGIPSLFHLRMNLLWTMQRTHSGTPNCGFQSTLSYAMEFWGRCKIPLQKAPFHLLEEIILQSWDSRVVALLYARLRDREIAVNNRDAVSEYISKLKPSSFLSLVEDIRQQAFTRKACNQKDHGEAADEEFIAHALFLRQGETYKMLKYGIKHADLGLIKRSIDACCLIFESSGQKRYAGEMLFLKRLISSKACDPVLQRAILSNSLVNTQGRPDSWLEVDLHIEHLNGELKNQLYVRKNSTFDVDQLFKVTALTGPYIAKLRAAIEPVIGERTNFTHTTRSPASDVHDLAYQLSEKSLRRWVQGRKHGLNPPDLYTKAQRTIEASVKRFNAAVVRLSENELEPVVDSDLTAEDVEADDAVTMLRVGGSRY